MVNSEEPHKELSKGHGWIYYQEGGCELQESLQFRLSTSQCSGDDAGDESSAHRDEGCSRLSGTSCSGFSSFFLPSSQAVPSEVDGFGDQRIKQFASPFLKRGFQVPAVTLQKLSVAQGAFPGQMPHPTAQETFLGPCLCFHLPLPAHPPWAAADGVLFPSANSHCPSSHALHSESCPTACPCCHLTCHTTSCV